MWEGGLEGVEWVSRGVGSVLRLCVVAGVAWSGGWGGLKQYSNKKL